MRSLRCLAVCCAAALSLAALMRVRPVESAQTKPNVLFIAIDDLRDWIGYLGANAQVRTPSMDRLATRGVRFTRSYCAAPVCNPSRTALLSGLRPSTSGVYDNGTDWRPVMADKTVTLPQHFKDNGYFVAGAGKIFHEAYRRDSDWTIYKPRDGGQPQPKGDGGVGGIRFSAVDCDDSDLEDYKTVTWCIDQLNQKHDKPMFLACGLHKPHMPWYVPRKYYDMYPLDKIILPKTLPNDLDDIPPAGVRMAKPKGDHADIVKAKRWKDAVQGYLAAITFCDAQVGRLMEAFDKSGYRSNTVVVFWTDHGWHLGEKEHWRKFALWEESTRSPLVIAAPGTTKANTVCNRTVDFMSLYPTLTDLCGLPTPAHVEGKSIRKLLENPSAAWETPAVTTHGYMNHAVRTEQWRYIRYANGDEELYDETKDPHEWTNLAKNPELAEVKAQLAKWMPAKNAGTTRGKGKGKGKGKAGPTGTHEED